MSPLAPRGLDSTVRQIPSPCIGRRLPGSAKRQSRTRFPETRFWPRFLAPNFCRATVTAFTRKNLFTEPPDGDRELVRGYRISRAELDDFINRYASYSEFRE